MNDLLDFREHLALGQFRGNSSFAIWLWSPRPSASTLQRVRRLDAFAQAILPASRRLGGQHLTGFGHRLMRRPGACTET